MNKFYALAEPTRRKILEMLASQGELSASDICEKFSISPPAISQHLKVLREAGLVRMEKRAQQRIYQINPDAVTELQDWARHLTELWNQRFDALDGLIQVEKQKLLLNETRKDEENDGK
jgi:DNA-binding transcriptional ArsR family regulator